MACTPTQLGSIPNTSSIVYMASPEDPDPTILGATLSSAQVLRKTASCSESTQLGSVNKTDEVLVEDNPGDCDEFVPIPPTCGDNYSWPETVYVDGVPYTKTGCTDGCVWVGPTVNCGTSTGNSFLQHYCGATPYWGLTIVACSMGSNLCGYNYYERSCGYSPTGTMPLISADCPDAPLTITF